jgi:MtN3 and saliva related transmembrane protein
MLDQVAPALGAVVTGYGVVAGAASLLQARRMLRRGTSSDVSLAFLGLYVAGYALWLLYGLAIGSLPLILVDVVGMLCGAVTLGAAVLLRRRPARDGEAPRIGRPVALHRPPSITGEVRPTANLSAWARHAPARPRPRSGTHPRARPSPRGRHPVRIIA